MLADLLDRGGRDTWLAHALLEAGLLDVETLREALFEVRERRPGGATLARTLVERKLLAPEALEAFLLRQAEADTLPWAPSPTRPAEQGLGTLGGYRLLRELGAGGMGVVYLAESADGARRAIKTLAVGADPEELLRFQREAQAQARVDKHPNVVAIHSLGHEGKRLFIVMDVATGGSLADRLRGGPLPPEEAARVVHGLANGLAHVHAHGVLHRDLKPANVLFSEDGTPQLVDFGLAKVSWGKSLTQTGALLGTPSYMAPEQVHGDKAAIGPRTDVYGLGAVLYHCLTGRPPFKEGSVIATLAGVVEAPPVPPSQLAPGIQEDLEAICLRALAKNPADRPASAGELRDALERVLAPAPGAGPSPWLAGGLIAALVLGAAGVTALRGEGDPPEPAAATSPADSPTAELPAPPPPSDAAPSPPVSQPSGARRSGPPDPFLVRELELSPGERGVVDLRVPPAAWSLQVVLRPEDPRSRWTLSARPLGASDTRPPHRTEGVGLRSLLAWRGGAPRLLTETYRFEASGPEGGKATLEAISYSRGQRVPQPGLVPPPAQELCFPGPPTPTADRLYAVLGKGLWGFPRSSPGDVQAALAELEALASQDGNRHKRLLIAWAMTRGASVDWGQVAGALAPWEEAPDSDPHAAWLIGRARLERWQKGELEAEQVVPLLEVAHTAFPSSLNVCESLARAYAKAGRRSEAEPLWAEAHAMAPGRAAPNHHLARACLRSSPPRWREAVEHFLAAMRDQQGLMPGRFQEQLGQRLLNSAVLMWRSRDRGVRAAATLYLNGLGRPSATPAESARAGEALLLGLSGEPERGLQRLGRATPRFPRIKERLERLLREVKGHPLRLPPDGGPATVEVSIRPGEQALLLRLWPERAAGWSLEVAPSETAPLTKRSGAGLPLTLLRAREVPPLREQRFTVRATGPPGGRALLREVPVPDVMDLGEVLRPHVVPTLPPLLEDEFLFKPQKNRADVEALHFVIATARDDERRLAFREETKRRQARRELNNNEALAMADLRLRAGIALLKPGAWDRAEQEARRSSSRTDPRIAWLLARLAREKQDSGGASRLLSGLRDRLRPSIYLDVNLAAVEVHLQRGEREEALEIALEALAVAPHVPWVHRVLGDLHLRSEPKAWDRAKAHLVEAVRRSNRDRGALLEADRVSTLLWDLRAEGRVAEIARAAAELPPYPTSQRSHGAHALLLGLAGRLSEARRVLESLRSNASRDPDWLDHLTRRLDALGS